MTNKNAGVAGAFLTGFTALFVAATAASADSGRGKLLYENQCSGCHESSVHIRDDHKAKSITDIRAAVLRWSETQKLHWGPAEINDVTDYLDETFYHYRRGPD